MIAVLRAALSLAGLVLAMLGARWLAPEAAARSGPEAVLGLGCVLIGGFAGGELSHAVRLPRITGYMGVGFLLGPSLWQHLAARPPFLTPEAVATLGLLDDLAIGLIAFAAGGELQWRAFRPRLRSVVAVSVGQIACVFPLVALGVWLVGARLGLPPGPATLAGALLVAGIAVSNSPSEVLAIRAETGARGPLADTVLGVVILGDVAVVVLFTVTVAVARSILGAAGAEGVGAWVVAWEILGSLGAGAVLGAALAKLLSWVRAEQPALLLAAAIGTMFLARQYHLSGLLVCLAAGFVVQNLSRQGAPLLQAVERSTVVVFTVFFTISGARLHLDALAGAGLALALIPALRAVGLWLGSRAAARLARAEDVVVRSAWTGLLGQAGLSLGLAAAAARAFPDLGDALTSVVFGTIVVNEVAGPILFRVALVRAGEAREDGESAGARAVAPVPAPR